MTVDARSLSRAGGVLVGSLLIVWAWGLDATAFVRLPLLIAALSILWARIDLRRRGPGMTEKTWSGTAAVVAAGVLVFAGLQGWQPLFIVIIAIVAGAGVVVPVWAFAAPAQGDDSHLAVSRATQTTVTVGGVSVFVALPILVLGFGAAVEWSGCFLACREPDHALAVGLYAAVLVLLVDVIMWGIAAWRGFPRALTLTAAVPLIACAAATFLMA